MHPDRLSSVRTLFALAVALVSLAAAVPAHADFRTRSVRIVPETDWKPAESQSLAIEVVSQSSHETSPEFVKALTKELEEQFGRVLKFTIDPKAKIKLRFVIVELDPGSAAKRFAIGFGTGKAYVGGDVEVIEKKKTIGKLTFSVQPTLPGVAAMARETAAPLALKIKTGERDKELHPLKKK